VGVNMVCFFELCLDFKKTNNVLSQYKEST